MSDQPSKPSVILVRATVSLPGPWTSPQGLRLQTLQAGQRAVVDPRVEHVRSCLRGGFLVKVREKREA